MFSKLEDNVSVALEMPVEMILAELHFQASTPIW
jgi:hypothetical protein